MTFQGEEFFRPGRQQGAGQNWLSLGRDLGGGGKEVGGGASGTGGGSPPGDRRKDKDRSLEGPRAGGDGGGVGREAQSLGDLEGRKGGLPVG